MQLQDTSNWAALETKAHELENISISDLFSAEGCRFSQLSFSHEGLLLDLSKQRFSAEVLTLLIDLAHDRDLPTWRDRLFAGDRVNESENRAALHTALRSPVDLPYIVEGEDLSAAIHHNLNKMGSMVDSLLSGQWRGYTGHPVDTVVNIGVGGSDLGPLMACRALADNNEEEENPLKIHFVSSMDGSQLSELLNQLNPARTLFVISSKSFTTIDTLANAATAREWLINSGNCRDEVLLKRHFIGVTANSQKAADWGIPSDNQLEFWDWTGGRYSMWSAIGLPIALRLGMGGFYQFLQGAHAMDKHFQEAPLEKNIPVLLALAGIWNINFLGINAHAVLPYDGRLQHLPAYLEQLEMESNGKSVTREGEVTGYKTCPILWGEVGTNAQHAFYQLLHQGTESVMCDFIVAANRYQDSVSAELQHQHKLNLANCLAQSRILAFGDSILNDSESAPVYKRYKGNQPCTTIVLDQLDPYRLGQLIAMYEHKVFVQSVIWGINPFDQWGVELGKQVATSLVTALEPGGDKIEFDPSTNGLLQHINKRS